jgi:hypothetical protein
MSSIVVAIIVAAAMAIPVAAALLVVSIRGRRDGQSPVLSVRHMDREDDRLLVELVVTGKALSVRVYGIAVEGSFAARVLAQPPAGFLAGRPVRQDATRTWRGRLVVRRGTGHPLWIPMRTDIAATGSYTFLYTYRRGLVTRTETATIDYRPLLIAVGA